MNANIMNFNFAEYKPGLYGRACVESDCKGKLNQDTKKSSFCSAGHFNVGQGWARPACVCGADSVKATGHAYWCDVLKWEGV